MTERVEKSTWLNLIPERLKRHKNIETRDLNQFLSLIREKNPSKINISMVEKPITFDNTPPSVGLIEYYEFGSSYTFGLDSKNQSVVKYLEIYPESRIYVKEGTEGKVDIKKMEDMRIRAIITAINRQRRINLDFPQIETQIISANPKDSLKIDKPEIESVQNAAQKLNLTPFFI